MSRLPVATVVGNVGAAADFLLQSATPGDCDSGPRAQIGEALWRWTLGEVSFEAALDLPANWRIVLRRHRRDQLILEIARQGFAALQGRPLSRAIAKACRLYQAGAWKRDRHAKRRPDGINGMIFDLLQLGEIPGPDQIRNIISGIAG